MARACNIEDGEVSSSNCPVYLYGNMEQMADASMLIYKLLWY